MSEGEGLTQDGAVAEPQVTETPPEPQAPAPPAVDPQLESRARIQGWVPKEEWRGDPSIWRPADEFVKRADEMMPILKSVNQKLESKVQDLTGRLEQTKAMIDKMVKIQSRYSEDFYDTKLAEIRSKKLEAVQAGDTERYVQLEQQESKISRPEKIEPMPPANENHVESLHPEVQRWIGENNTWFGKDKEMTDYAVFVGEQLKNSGDPLALPGNEYAFCQRVKERVQSTFVSKFQNPNNFRSSVDDSNLRGGASPDVSGNGGKDWNHLPPEAKAQCMKFMAEIPGFTKEKYIRDYYEY